ncbi:MAG: glycosyltransferase [Flavobacteriales bacterium]|nr:glycosyltransferase [Flavobacteriales bacterium]
MPRPLLIVSHTFPPYRGIGGRRWMKFAKALARRGHAVHVIHSAAPDDLKGSPWTDDLGTPGLICHPLPQRYPTVLFKRPLTSAVDKVMYRVWGRVLPLLVKGNWFDKTVFWQRPFLDKACALIDRHGIRDVLITGAPFRLLYFGVLLKQRRPLHLVCDLRDTWTWQDGYGGALLSPERKAYERRLEEAVMAGSDRITTPHPAVVEHLMRTYPQHATKVRLLGHAIDPDELGPPRPEPSPALRRLIYAGSMYGAQEADRYFDQVMAAFEHLRSIAPDIFADASLDLYITGHGTENHRRLVEARGLQHHIRFHAPLPAKAIFPRIAAADAVLLFIPSMNRDVLGTKFTEVFHLRRPVIHVGDAGLVSHHIEQHRLGVSLRVDDLAHELPRLMTGERRVTVDTAHDLSEHLLDHIAAGIERDLLSP